MRAGSSSQCRVSGVGRESVGGHGDGFAAVEPIMVAIPIHRPADIFWFAVPQRERRVTLLLIGHAPYLGQVLGRSLQSWANIPPRALTGANWWASPTKTVLAPA